MVLEDEGNVLCQLGTGGNLKLSFVRERSKLPSDNDTPLKLLLYPC